MNRFWDKVDKRCGQDSCWEWKAGQDSNSYGLYWLYGKHEKAHRVAWMKTNGEIPSGMLVCHHCDNRVCCNPSHLFLGTHSDNAKDMVNKGRGADFRGEKHPQSKLDEMDIKFIRYWLKKGYSQRKIASVFGVDQTHISGIKTGKTWGHVESL